MQVTWAFLGQELQSRPEKSLSYPLFLHNLVWDFTHIRVSEMY